MRKSLMLALSVASVVIATPASATSYTYVGNWFVGNGPVWTSNPAVYNAQQVAALLFGGTASDYAISTLGTDPSLINFRSHVDGYGDSQYLYSTVAENYSLQTGTGYDHYPAYSAYVLDHSCFNRYGNPSQTCGPNEPGQNFAFRIDAAVPEPATWAMMLVGFGGIGFAMRRRNRAIPQVARTAN